MKNMYEVLMFHANTPKEIENELNACYSKGGKLHSFQVTPSEKEEFSLYIVAVIMHY